MVRLTVENLEGRELMAVGVMAGIAPAPEVNFTPPIGSNKGSVVAGAEAPANGIIAILIGLRAPTPTGTNDVLVSSFQGGCANQGAGEQALRGFHILPYLEQESLHKRY